MQRGSWRGSLQQASDYTPPPMDHDHEHDDEPVAEPDEDLQAEAEREARRRFALAQIRQYGDPALRLTAYEVSDFDDDLKRLVDRMTDLMHDAQGVGLAATQVGVLRRLFVFEPDENGPRTVVNPKLVDVAEVEESDAEGCLSLQGVRVPVERPTRVTLEGKNSEGEDVRYVLEGYSARIAQHELD